MYYFVLPIVAVVAILIIAGFVMSNKIIHPKTRTYEDTYNREVELGRLDKEWFDSLPKEEVTLYSPFGYKLYGMFFPVKDSKKAIIICHGITYTLYGSVKYMEMFYKRGYNVLIYDHRNHGKSGGDDTTFGYFEKQDLMACTDWVFNRCGFDCRIGVHGESMGAAIALQNSIMDPRLSFCIADCAFSDLRALLKYLFRYKYKLPSWPLLGITSFITRMRSGFYFGDISPIADIKKVSTPIFFIHGKDDKYIPPVMSENMYKVKSDIKKLYLAPNAKHAEAYANNKAEYGKLVEEFLDEIGM